MRVFFAGEAPLAKEEGWSREVDGWQGTLRKIIKRRLFSYYFHGLNIGNRLSKEVQLSRDYGMDLFLNSGAYSAYTQKKTISVDKYADFIHQHGKIFSHIANLDDVGDTGRNSWDNLKALETMGCKVIPVFHYQDDIIYLKKMMANYEFIALGGLVGAGAGRKKLRDWLRVIWGKYLTEKDGLTPRLKIHGFGLTDFDLMKRYPWFSVDSSSWVQAGIHGDCIFMSENSRLRTIVFSNESPSLNDPNSWHYENLNEYKKRAVDRWLLPHNVTARQCASHYSFRHLVNAATYQGLEAHIKHRRAPRRR